MSHHKTRYAEYLQISKYFPEAPMMESMMNNFVAIFIENFKAEYNQAMDAYRPKIKRPFNVFWNLIKIEKYEMQ